MAKSVVIVGGGSAGWMTAAYLKKAAPQRQHHPRRVGHHPVDRRRRGDLQHHQALLRLPRPRRAGLDAALQRHLQAGHPVRELARRRRHFYHPFQRYETVDGFNMGEWWLKLKPHEEPFDHACFTIPTLCDAKRSPQHLRRPRLRRQGPGLLRRRPRAEEQLLSEHKVQYPYAYHFDAACSPTSSAAMRRAAASRHVVDEVVEVQLGEDGGIDHVVTKEHGPIRRRPVRRLHRLPRPADQPGAR